MHASGPEGSLSVGCVFNELKNVMFECVTMIKALRLCVHEVSCPLMMLSSWCSSRMICLRLALKFSGEKSDAGSYKTS